MADKKAHGNKGKKRRPGESRPARLHRRYYSRKRRKGTKFKCAMIYGPLDAIDVACRRGLTGTEIGIGAVPAKKAAGNLCRIFAASELLRKAVEEFGGRYDDTSGKVVTRRGREYFVVQAFVHNLHETEKGAFKRHQRKIAKLLKHK